MSQEKRPRRNASTPSILPEVFGRIPIPGTLDVLITMCRKVDFYFEISPTESEKHKTAYPPGFLRILSHSAGYVPLRGGKKPETVDIQPDPGAEKTTLSASDIPGLIARCLDSNGAFDPIRLFFLLGGDKWLIEYARSRKELARALRNEEKGEDVEDP